MSSFIQINIYNETIEKLKTRGIDLQRILENNGINDTWIGEIPIRMENTEYTRPFKTISEVAGSFSDNCTQIHPKRSLTPDESSTSHQEIGVKLETPFDFGGDTSSSSIFDMFLNGGFIGEKDSPSRLKEHGDETVHNIKCHFPGCDHSYSWKVKYGKLRLIDHALTHNSLKLLTCRICGESIQNVRAIRTHYSKNHPDQRPTGYGMKSMPIHDVQLRELWRLCYGDYVNMVGEATVLGPAAKIRRIGRSNK